MPTARAEFAVILLDDKRILLSGGRVGGKGLDTTEIFDVVSENFFAGPELQMARYGHANVMTNDNQVLLVGGWLQWHDGEEEEISCTSEFLYAQKLVDLYGDEGRAARSTARAENLDTYEKFTTPGPGCDIGFCTAGLPVHFM